jgi:hypothetical protein
MAVQVFLVQLLVHHQLVIQEILQHLEQLLLTAVVPVVLVDVDLIKVLKALMAVQVGEVLHLTIHQTMVAEVQHKVKLVHQQVKVMEIQAVQVKLDFLTVLAEAVVQVQLLLHQIILQVRQLEVQV